jgi:hypothetical protein
MRWTSSVQPSRNYVLWMFTSYEGNNCIVYTYGLAMMRISIIFNPSKVISARALQLSMFTLCEGIIVYYCIITSERLLYYAIRSIIALWEKKGYCIGSWQVLFYCPITSDRRTASALWHKRHYCIVRKGLLY